MTHNIAGSPLLPLSRFRPTAGEAVEAVGAEATKSNVAGAKQYCRVRTARAGFPENFVVCTQHLQSGSPGSREPALEHFEGKPAIRFYRP